MPKPQRSQSKFIRNLSDKIEKLSFKKPVRQKNKKLQKFKLPKFSKLQFKTKFIFISIILIFFIPFYFFILKDLPSPSKLTSGKFPVSTKIFDRHGQLLYEIYADHNRTPIKLETLPEYVKQATIAIEDKNFYKHHGIAWEGITRAFINIVFKKNLQGGSTITQQLVKTTLLTSERTLKRKIREALLAFITEIRYSKNEILEMYLNHVPYGGTAYGIEQASKLYFNKSAKNLDLAEASLLAGLPQAPTRHSPFGPTPEAAKNRQQQTLNRMTEDKYINSEQAQTAFKQSLKFASQAINIKAPHFVLYVKQLLVEKYGQQTVEKGGLRVTTSLDYNLQQYAQAAIATETAKLKRMQVSNAAALITKPRTGEILTMVGSKDYFDTEIDGNVNITTSLRQPGSSIKPINYATGLIKGFNPATMFLDVPVCFSVPGQPAYCPRNYDNKFHGPTQMRFALASSYNIPAVKMLAANSLESMIATASAMGITTFKDPSRYGLSLTLGGGEVKMIDMAVAFAVFANAGLKVNLTPILKIEDYQGNILEEIDLVNELPSGEKVIPTEVAYLISHILLDNNARAPAFGTNSQLNILNHTVSVKTGTTDDVRDNWTIGYTPSFLTVTWVGNNDNSPMNPYLVSGVTGAAPIWHNIMTKILENQPDEWPKKPENIVGLQICNISGLLPGNSGCQTRYEYFIKDQQPTQTENIKKNIWVNKDTNKPPLPDQTDNLELKEHLVLSDPVQQEYCLTCQKDTDDKGEIHEPPYIIIQTENGFFSKQQSL